MAEVAKKPKKPLTLKLSMYSLLGVGVFMILGYFMIPVLVISLAFSFACFGCFAVYAFKNWKIPILMKVFTVGVMGSVLFGLNILIWWLKIRSMLSFELILFGQNLKTLLEFKLDNILGVLKIFEIFGGFYSRLYITITLTTSFVLSTAASVSLVLFVLYKLFRLMTKYIKPLMLRIAVTTVFFTIVTRLVGIINDISLLISNILLAIVMISVMVFLCMIRKVNIPGKPMLASLAAIAFGLMAYFLFNVSKAAGMLGVSDYNMYRFKWMYLAVLISIFLASLFVFIIMVSCKKCHISMSFLIADSVFTVLSLASYFIFDQNLIHIVSTYALCGFGFGVGIGIMWTVAVQIFFKKKKKNETVKPVYTRPKLADEAKPAQDDKSVKKELEVPKAPLPKLNK